MGDVILASGAAAVQVIKLMVGGAVLVGLAGLSIIGQVTESRLPRRPSADELWVSEQVTLERRAGGVPIAPTCWELSTVARDVIAGRMEFEPESMVRGVGMTVEEAWSHARSPLLRERHWASRGVGVGTVDGRVVVVVVLVRSVWEGYPPWPDGVPRFEIDWNRYVNPQRGR